LREGGERGKGRRIEGKEGGKGGREGRGSPPGDPPPTPKPYRSVVKYTRYKVINYH